MAERSIYIQLGGDFGLHLEEHADGVTLANDLGESAFLPSEALDELVEWWTKPLGQPVAGADPQTSLPAWVP
jgi:hypothetical protein